MIPYRGIDHWKAFFSVIIQRSVVAVGCYLVNPPGLNISIRCNKAKLNLTQSIYLILFLHTSVENQHQRYFKGFTFRGKLQISSAQSQGKGRGVCHLADYL